MKRIFLLIAFCFLLQDYFSQNTLYGVIGDTLVELNTSTGDASTVGYLGAGISNVWGMTYHAPSNKLLAIADWNSNPRLISIDRNTGLASFVGMLDITTPFLDIKHSEGISYDPVSGNIYAVMTEIGPPVGYYCSRLVTVNPLNANCTQVATISNTCSAIDEFDLITHRLGVLYGIDICPPNTSSLSTCSMVTGSASPVGLTGMFNTSFTDMATDPTTNQIYLSQSSSKTLLIISHLTGAASPIGTTHLSSEYGNNNLSAIAFAPVNSCQLGANFSFSGVCLGDTTFFNDLSVDSLSNIIDWKWLYGDGDSIVGVQNPSHLYSTSGNYNVTLIITNDSNCTDTITLPLTINPIFNLNRNDTICQGDSILLGGSFQTTAGTYTDSLQTVLGCDSVVTTNLIVNPTFSSLQSSTICQGDSILFDGNFYSIGGSYTDSLQSAEGCDSLLNLNLTVNPVFQFSLTQTICQGDSILLGGSFQTTAGLYTDSLQTTLGCDSLIVTTLTVGSVYNDTLSQSICQGDSILLGGSFQTTAGTYTDSFQTVLGCDSVVVTTLQIDTLITLTISDDTVSSPCNPVQLSVSGGSAYIWSPVNGLNCVTCANPIASPEITTTYTVVESSNSCNVTASVTIFVEGKSDFIIPNVFTPNHDNNNDGFNVKSSCIYSLEKKVFNRWGQLLFHSTQINEPWNGRTTAGDEATEGTYFYIIDVGFYKNGEEVKETYTGTITLLR